MATRTETDSMGPIEVDAARYWGAQTQRSLENFRIGGERMPRELILALARIKKASALVNRDLGLLPDDKARLIAAAAASSAACTSSCRRGPICADQSDTEIAATVRTSASRMGTATQRNLTADSSSSIA